VLAMTAHAMRADQDECIKAGMDDYISKPFEPAELLTKIDHWSRIASQQETAVLPNRPTSRIEQPVDSTQNAASPIAFSHSSEIPIIEFNSLCRRVLNDRPMAFQLLQRASDRLDRDLDDMNTAFQNRDFDRLRKAAHKLKGSAGNLSAEPLQQACENLELSCPDGNENQVAGHYELLMQAAETFRAEAQRLLQV
jgi:two-component system, sensor histidine kinase and response regulator